MPTALIACGVFTLLVLGGAILLTGSASRFFVPTTQYQQVYTLVNDKISIHGAIVVNLPKGVSKVGAQEGITFDPAISGSWLTSSLPDALIYKPSASLSLGKHYRVSLTVGAGTIKKDFVVDEDPAVTAVFPNGAAEAELSSAITIVFNRPMVPLTTLSELESKAVPVAITPQTPGRFKWISTRTLQFIPSGTLFGSSHYSVQIQANFASVDGLAVPSMNYTFTTKVLRLNSSSTDTITYKDPIRFTFNQPVDLEKTLPGITVKNNSGGGAVPFTASYGTASIWSESARAYVDIEDRSVISITPNGSLYGHSNIWDFSTSYTASIATVYPVGGDITMSGTSFSPAVSTTLTTSDLLRDISVASDKTTLASVDLFDPSGTTTVSLYEDIDIGRSSIHAKGLAHIGYGTKCADSGTDDSTKASSDCMLIPDKSQLLMTFDQKAYTRGEKVPIVFDSLINIGGYRVNARSITKTLTVYPELHIVKTLPTTGAKDASISDLTICTNVPLQPQDSKTFYENFKTNGYIVFGRWDPPYLESKDIYDSFPPCDIGTYVNRIHYGLLPAKPYTIGVSVDDVFGAHASMSLQLTTQAAPNFYLRFQSLQKMYDVTTPDHTKLTYATENFDYVNASVCKVSPESMVRLLATQPADVTTAPDGSLPCIDTVTKRIALRPDQWVNQYFQIDLKDYYPDSRGQYVVSFSHPQYTDEQGRLLHARTYVSVTNLAVVDNRVNWSSYNYFADIPNLTRSDLRGAVFWVTGMGRLAPIGVSGALIDVYQREGNAYDGTVVLAKANATNENGITEFPLIADFAGASVTVGDDSAVLSRWTDTLENGSGASAYQDERVYLYSDRPIYRPGQTVFIKGLLRVGFDGAYSIFKNNPIKVEVQDSSGNTILTQKVPVNAFGTFAASISLPADAPLGSYSVTALNAYASFEVKDYVGAAFEAKSATDKDEYVAGDTATISASGVYYFGVPLDGGTLEYSVTSQDYYFNRYADQNFNFGGSWYDCYDCGYGNSYLKRGKVMLDSSGKATVALSLDFKSLYTGSDGDQSKIFVFDGTITDKQGKAVSFEKSFIVHHGEYYLGVHTDPYFTGIGQPFSLMLKTVDTQGKSVSRSGIQVSVSKVNWQWDKRQEVDSGYYNQPHRMLTPVITRKVSTDGSGNFTETDKLTDAGEYEIDAVGTDSRGNPIKSTTSIYVYGEGTVDVEPTNNATLNLTAEKSDVKLGDTASFVIQNPYPHARALISIERGRIFTYEVVNIDQSLYRYQFPITEEYVPNVYASVVLLGPGPDVKFGQVEFTVDRAQKRLSITVTSDKQSYLPGETVHLTVTTKDAQGNPVPADVSVAVADLSVLALSGNPKKDPLVFFYSGFPLAVSADTNVKNLLVETPIPTGTKGGDGGSPADLAARKRGEFKDTAYWQSDVITDAQGVGAVSFTLPDNLTTWQVESVGITKDTKVGVDYETLKAQKDVMTIPIGPRFVVPGDEFMLGAKIFNQTATAQTLDVSLTSPSLILEDTAHTRVSIGPGSTATAYFKVKAPIGKAEGTHTYTLSAKNSDYNDTVEQSLSITRNETYESTATDGSTAATSISEYLYLPDSVLADRGGLTINTNATLAVYLSDAFTYLFDYPYGCSQQIASKLSAIAVAKRALAIPNVGSSFTVPKVTFDNVSYTTDQAEKIGIAQLYENQVSDGGFSYYKGMNSDPYLTIEVLNSLMDVKQAGYPVRQDVIDAAVQYIKTQISNFQTHSDTDSLIHVVYVLSRTGTEITALVADIEKRTTSRFLSDSASSNSLAYLALIASRGVTTSSYKDKIFASLENRVEIDSRGAYLRTNPENFGWQYYETTQSDTALMIKAIAADTREYAETDNLIKWLVASRASDGSWGSTDSTLVAIDALTDYLERTHETESHFTLTTTLDDTQVAKTDFNKSNILATSQTFLPVSSIALGAMHALTFTKSAANNMPNPFYYDLSLKYYLPVSEIMPRDEGIAITRAFYAINDAKNEHPLTSTKVGTVVRGRLTLVVPKEHHLFSVEDYIPAGFELIDFSLATADKSLLSSNSLGVNTARPGSAAHVAGTTSVAPALSGFLRSGLFAAAGLFGLDLSQGIDTLMSPITYQEFYPDHESLYDDRLLLFAQDVQPGTYTYEYYVRATTPGTFSHLPAIAKDLYYPEDFGRTAGDMFTVEQ